VADASADDFREFTREMNLRFSKAFDAGVRSIEANTKVLEQNTRVLEQMEGRLEQMGTRLRIMNQDAEAHRREWVEEMRAQRQALFRVLDRLDGNGGTAPAT